MFSPTLFLGRGIWPGLWNVRGFGKQKCKGRLFHRRRRKDNHQEGEGRLEEWSGGWDRGPVKVSEPSGMEVIKKQVVEGPKCQLKRTHFLIKVIHSLIRRIQIYRWAKQCWVSSCAVLIPDEVMAKRAHCLGLKQWHGNQKNKGQWKG